MVSLKLRQQHTASGVINSCSLEVERSRLQLNVLKSDQARPVASTRRHCILLYRCNNNGAEHVASRSWPVAAICLTRVVK